MWMCQVSIQKVAHHYMQISNMLPSSARSHTFPNLVADTYYKVTTLSDSIEC
jgi:hypothetical protein